MDIDFIKWMVNLADVFEVNGDQLIFPESGFEMFDEHLFTLRVWELVWFPLLLVRAIEGINKGYQNESKYAIEQGWDYVVATYKNSDFEQFTIADYDFSFDKAKEATLKYIYTRGIL